MKYIFFALFMGFAAMSYGQNTLSGKVSDAQNQPLIGVSVYLPELHKGTVTDIEGQYEFNNIPTGKLQIVFSFIGFETQNLNVSVSQSPVNITMTESEHKLDEVVVSTGFNKLQSQNVMKVEHAGVKQMQQQGITSLAEGITTIPGVSQVSTGTSIGKPVIRGLSSNRILVYSQGVRLENQQFGDEHGLGLSDSGVESVEVIKGPASLLYGSDALGGVLYVNPEKFADANTVKADFGQRFYSNTLGSSTSLGVKGSTDNWKFSLRGGYNTHSDYETGDGDRVTNTRYNETDIKAGIGYNNQKMSSVFRYNYNRLDLGIPEEGIAEQSTSKNTEFPRQGIDNHIASLHNSFFFGKSSLDANIGYIFNDRSEFEDSNDAVLRMKLQTLNYDLKYHFPQFGKFEIIAGIQGMHQTNDNFGEEYLIPNAEVNDFGVFGTTNYTWNSNVIQAGIRYDNRHITSEANGIIGEEGSFAAIDRQFDSFNASLGYKTDLSPKWILRLNLASGFRAPNLAELTSNGVHEGTNRYEIGNANLNNEQNVQADLNLEFKGTHFEIFVNGFYNHIDNYIYTQPTGEVLEDNDVFAYTQDNAQLFGGEAGIHFHPHPLDWLHVESSFESVTGKKQNGDYLPLIPANNWNNTIRTEFNIKNWLKNGFARFNVSTTFDQDNVSGFETRSGGYTLFNAGFGGKVTFGKTAFEVSLNGNNLTDKTYIAHLSRLKVDGVPNIGRNVVLGVNFNI
ncbi:TonB-dependent receptor [Flavobacterium sp. MAH-1]|uniref:TonB-dependent receptor n=1 Tax=Flavobacterium agri TaxID=2743471 RepID=A0A7Y8Y2P8_9FLAO|nr:TonB-dependent receptor [Flavobacterium agri]NUY81432.1 TonB-dependent receptor [Flavobacterium agri]NYA71456.1 TonB-dependent receptor [Flavobacterium agri]